MTAICQLQMPNQRALFGHIRGNARFADDMVRHNEALGSSVAICGAGPSLKDYLPGLHASYPHRHEVWACNSALSLVSATHAFSIDMSEGMLREWGEPFNGTYLISSSVHPKLVRQLRQRKGKIRFFHSYLGIPHAEPNYEYKLYTTLYPSSVQVGHGLNSVPRAVCLALAMGFSSITVYGADCGVSGQPQMPDMGNEEEYNDWLSRVPLYADGRTASVFGPGSSMMEAEIDGRRWHTRPDMAISAVHLLELQDAYPGRITLVGETLPNALRGKDQAFMQRLPQLSAVGEVSNLRTERVA